MNIENPITYYEKYLLTKADYICIVNNIPSNSTQFGAGSIKKWNTLEHNGVIFYPEYDPSGIQIRIDGKLTTLNPMAEEYLSYFVHPRYDKYRNQKFNKNFLKDWKKMLSQEDQQKIKSIEQINYDELKNYVLRKMEEKREENLSKTKEEKVEEKNEKEKKTDPYKFAIVDGIKQAVDNFMVEPPTIFVGRGQHPKSGSIKMRLYPEDVTLNVSGEMKIPKPIVPGSRKDHQWGEIITDNTLEWIASWQNNVTKKTNYARFGRKSSFKMQSDMNKYELARKLKKKVNSIREDNDKNMESNSSETRQHATALYLIDKLALRIGGDKKEEEADTVGVTTLKIKNVDILDDNKIRLDFLGKDSVRYINKFAVTELVHKNLKSFSEGKDKNASLFDLINAESLNRYIRGFMDGLTSKVFRTYNASYLMQIELKKVISIMKDYCGKDFVQRAKYLYDMANLKVAKLCNHQKVLSQTSNKRLDQTDIKIKNIKVKIKKLTNDKEKAKNDGKKTKNISLKIESEKNKLKQLRDKKTLLSESKSLSAGTSKINYIDPRITIAFVKKLKLLDNINSFFNESHRKQFEWAMNVEENYVF
jgi:DNA topoisomerase I